MPLKEDSNKSTMKEVKADGIIEALLNAGKGGIKMERFHEESLDIDLTACSAIPVAINSKCSATIFDCFDSESWQRMDDVYFKTDEDQLEVKRNKRKSTLPKKADTSQACCSSTSVTPMRINTLPDELQLAMDVQPSSPLIMVDTVSEPRSDPDNDSAGEMVDYISSEIFAKPKLDIIYFCHICMASFSLKDHFDNHYRTVHGEPVVLYTCLKCDKRFDKYKTFRGHCNRHANSDRHKCDICSKGFQQKSSLRLHAASHAKSIECVHCDRHLPSVKDYKSHLRSDHPDVSGNKKTTTNKKSGGECPICGKMLMTNSSLSMHLKIHQNDPRFKCEQCGQKFVQKINLIHHIKKHTGERPYICDLCNKSFIERSHLLRHKNYHLHIRQFKCDQCGKTYKTERCLKVHSQIHTESRPHVCEQCNKGFLSSSKLKQHYNIHTGARPFKCKYCIKDFTNFPNWLKHIRRRHKVDHRTGEQLEKMPEFLLKGRKKVTDTVKGTEVIAVKPVGGTQDQERKKAPTISKMTESKPGFELKENANGIKVVFGENIKKEPIHSQFSILTTDTKEGIQLIYPTKTEDVKKKAPKRISKQQTVTMATSSVANVIANKISVLNQPVEPCKSIQNVEVGGNLFITPQFKRLDFQQILHENKETNLFLSNSSNVHQTKTEVVSFATHQSIQHVAVKPVTETKKKRKTTRVPKQPKEPKQKKSKAKLLLPKEEPRDDADVSKPPVPSSGYISSDLTPKFENIDESTLPLNTSEDLERATNIIMEQALAMEDDVKYMYTYDDPQQPNEMFDCGEFKIITNNDEMPSFMVYDQPPMIFTSNILPPIDASQPTSMLQSDSMSLSSNFMQTGMLFGENSSHLLGRFPFEDSGILPN